MEPWYGAIGQSTPQKTLNNLNAEALTLPVLRGNPPGPFPFLAHGSQQGYDITP